MKSKTLIILFLAIANMALAQKEPIPYEWFEEQSKIISDLQYKANGQEIHFSNDKILTANFIKDNFSINYSDKLASVSVNFKGNGNEGLIVAENIDLTRVKDLIEDSDGGILLMFPSAEIEWQLYKKEGEPTIEKDKFFYFKAANETDNKKMFATFWSIINRLKIDKGLITVNEVDKQWEDWQNLKIEDFYIKYPKSILAHEYNEVAFKKVGHKYYNEDNYSEALKWYERAANLGSGVANYMIGHLYFSGRGVEKDQSIAFKYYLKGAEQGDVDALRLTGQSYYYGWGTQVNEEKGRSFFKQAINYGCAKSRENLWKSYKYKLQSNASEIIAWYQNFANTKGPLEEMEMEYLGMAYFYNQEYSKALEWLKKACEKGGGSDNIASTIREIYSKGLGGVKKDKKAGKYWEGKCG